LNSEDFPTVRIGRRIYANRSEINEWIKGIQKGKGESGDGKSQFEREQY